MIHLWFTTETSQAFDFNFRLASSDVPHDFQESLNGDTAGHYRHSLWVPWSCVRVGTHHSQLTYPVDYCRFGKRDENQIFTPTRVLRAVVDLAKRRGSSEQTTTPQVIDP
jgi:hypothetical protein